MFRSLTSSFRSRATVGSAVLIALLVMVSGFAFGQADSDHVFYACAMNGKLTKLRVDEAPICTGRSEVVQWNGEGPAGPQGPPGPPGGSSGGGTVSGATEAFIEGNSLSFGYSSVLPGDGQWNFGNGIGNDIEANLNVGFVVDPSQYPVGATFRLRAVLYASEEEFGSPNPAAPVTGCVRFWDEQTQAAVPGSEICHEITAYGPSGFVFPAIESGPMSLSPDRGRYAVQTMTDNHPHSVGVTVVRVHVDW